MGHPSVGEKQRRRMILEALKKDPQLSNAEIGRRFGVHREVVRNARSKMFGNGSRSASR